MKSQIHELKNLNLKILSKKLILGAALLMGMVVSTNTFAAPKSFNGERSKTEMKHNWGKNDDMKKGQGKQGSCHHHNKNGCHKK